ncbi:sensor histidine kinase [Limimaricola sp.]|uniref:sensor histidine kinase n=1 Tax=Limimaricola sp. TaxID=2211665 RepID=UPI004059B2B4
MDTSSAKDLHRPASRAEDAAFLSALDQSPLPMWLSNADYEGSYFNRAWLEFRGRDLAQEIEGGWLCGIHPEDLDGLGDYAGALSEGRAFQVEYRLLRHDGVWRWMLDSGSPRFDPEGRLIGFIGSCVDITARREAEAARERAAMMLGMSLEIAAIGTWEFDPETRLVTASARTQEMFGLTAVSPPQPVETYLGQVHAEDRAALRDLLGTCPEGGESSYTCRLSPGGGALRWVSARGRMVRLADGSRRLIGAITDITKAKRLEAEREAALAHRQTLLAELNHRMKNNLHLILSMLRLEAGRDPGPEAFAAVIERVEAVSALHAQLDFDAGAGRVDFGAYLGDLAAKLRRSVLEGTGIRLDCDAAPVELDLDRAVPLGIVVNELVTNAIKYAFPQGGGRIALRLTRAADGGVLVVVEDDGHGPDRSAGHGPESGLGTRLVTGLCAQISARIDSQSLPGMRHEIHLPLSG